MLNKTDKLISLLNVQVRTLAFCGLASGTRLALPDNPDAKVLYLLDGEASLVGADAGCTQCRPGMMVFIPPRQAFEIGGGAKAAMLAHWDEAAVPSGDMLLVAPAHGARAAVQFACVMIPAQSLSFRLLHDLRRPLFEDLSGDPTVTAAFSQMLSELRNPQFGSRVLVEALMMQCYVHAIRNQLRQPDEQFLPMNEWRDPRIGEAMLGMIDRPGAQHSLDSLARGSGMSRTMFAQRFTRAFDRSPMEMLKEVRVNRAAELLKTTSMSIDAVAAAVGYESRSYFSRTFKKSFGMDPTAYRRQAASLPAQVLRADLWPDGD